MRDPKRGGEFQKIVDKAGGCPVRCLDDDGPNRKDPAVEDRPWTGFQEGATPWVAGSRSSLPSTNGEHDDLES